ncbi:threonylcarbamoyl-AMP synthase [Sphingomonas sabuli]|uniref:Threonylcarbamoyl-AMP synthase n=1 Tax=Sphingomonas sabuli TaxID=2764186 RepID=A0A7G9L479_9SPHN|nr:L-threonylcarbamoyladenylate synthase [Sphingomonas sabuli]QNM83428.1 threonylcarbamoyl-AMP synthase [Sphingomonas sabuli]
MQTRTLPFSDATIAKAARLVLDGSPVAVPTETVYGLAADGTNAEAVARIYEAKGRPSFNPLIVHVLTIADAEKLVYLGPLVRQAAEAHWPGPLTIVAPRRADSGIASIVSAGLDTLAVRVPQHPAMRALLEAVGRPLAAPSANASGSISSTRADHVLHSLGGRIPLIVDDGPCSGGIESTIIAERDGALQILRSGPLEIAGAASASGSAIEAPGQMASHYAPSKPLRLNANSALDGEYLIGFGDIAGAASLSPTGDLVEAAASLFDLLHRADRADNPRIAVAPVPDTGLGAAINDRLRRAAAPR